jgi:hypothetical protein
MTRVLAGVATAVILLGSTGARATVIGEAFVSARPGNNTNFPTQSVFIPWLATQFQTPVISLNVAPVFGDTEFAAATVGVDLPFGVLAASTKAEGRSENSSMWATPHAIGTVKFIEEVQVQSAALPVGTPVDMRLDAVAAWMGAGGASSGGGPASLLNDLDADMLAYVMPLVPGTGVEARFGAVAVGVSQQGFGPLVLPATVGSTVHLEFNLRIESFVTALGYLDLVTFRMQPSSGNSSIQAVLAFGAEAIAAEGFAALAAGPAAPSSSDVVLYSPTLEGRFPGVESLDPANVASHMLPIPEPGSALLIGTGLGGLLTLRKRGVWRRAR